MPGNEPAVCWQDLLDILGDDEGDDSDESGDDLAAEWLQDGQG